MDKFNDALAAKKRLSSNTDALSLSPATAPKRSVKSQHTSQLLNVVHQNAQKITKRLSDAFTNQKIPSKQLIDPIAAKKMPINVYAGVVVTSSRSSRRR
jgi:hypothetical protein